MRMSYMYYLLKKSIDGLKRIKKVEESANNNRKWTVLTNYSALNDTLSDLHCLPAFKKDIDAIQQILSDSRFVVADKTKHFPIEGEKLYKDIQSLQYKLEIIVDFLEQCGFSEDQLGFDVKMPPTDDFSEFANNIDTLQKVLNQCPYLTINDERVKIQSVDIGSIWLKFAVVATSTSLILSNLATIVDKCVKIQSHYITMQQQEENLRQAQLKNDVLNSVIEANKMYYDKLIDNAATELEQEIPNVELSNEDKERVKMSIDNLVKLIDKGMEIYASIDAPEEVKDLFPTSDEIKSLSEPLKQLSESNDEE